MQAHYSYLIVYYRTWRYWYNSAPVGSEEPVENIKLRVDSRRKFTDHQWVLITVGYVFVLTWLAFCCAARSPPCILLGVFTLLTPLWFSLYLAIAFGNPDDYFPSDHLGVAVDFKFSCE